VGLPVLSASRIASRRRRRARLDEAQATVGFGHPTFCLILCEIRQKKNVRGNAGGREEVWVEGEGRRLTDGAGFGRGSSQMLGAPASNLSILEAQLEQKKRGAREGCRAIYGGPIPGGGG
jgi:hypothetical protein